MTDALLYKGYRARVEFDARDRLFVGQVLGMADRITFHGATVDELITDFHASVDHYLEDCAQTGRNPQKPASGKLMLRIRPEVHLAVSIAAHGQGKSINQWVDEVLARATSQ